MDDGWMEDGGLGGREEGGWDGMGWDGMGWDGMGSVSVMLARVHYIILTKYEQFYFYN